MSSNNDKAPTAPSSGAPKFTYAQLARQSTAKTDAAAAAAPVPSSNPAQTQPAKSTTPQQLAGQSPQLNQQNPRPVVNGIPKTTPPTASQVVANGARSAGKPLDVPVAVGGSFAKRRMYIFLLPFLF